MLLIRPDQERWKLSATATIMSAARSQASDVHAISAVRIPSTVCAYRAHGTLDFAVTQHHFVGLDFDKNHKLRLYPLFLHFILL